MIDLTVTEMKPWTLAEEIAELKAWLPEELLHFVDAIVARIEAERAACEEIARCREKLEREAMWRELNAGYGNSATACQAAANSASIIADAIRLRKATS